MRTLLLPFALVGVALSARAQAPFDHLEFTRTRHGPTPSATRIEVDGAGQVAVEVAPLHGSPAAHHGQATPEELAQLSQAVRDAALAGIPPEDLLQLPAVPGSSSGTFTLRVSGADGRVRLVGRVWVLGAHAARLRPVLQAVEGLGAAVLARSTALRVAEGHVQLVEGRVELRSSAGVRYRLADDQPSWLRDLVGRQVRVAGQFTSEGPGVARVRVALVLEPRFPERYVGRVLKDGQRLRLAPEGGGWAFELFGPATAGLELAVGQTVSVVGRGLAGFGGGPLAFYVTSVGAPAPGLAGALPGQ